MRNKLVLFVIGLLLLCNVVAGSVYAANPSVNLDDTPVIEEIGGSEVISSPDLLPEQGNIEGGSISGSGGSASGNIQTVVRLSIEDIIVTPIGKADEFIDDPKLSKNMKYFKEGYSKCEKANHVYDILPKEKLTEVLSNHEGTEKLTLDDFKLYSMFDIYLDSDIEFDSSSSFQLSCDFSFLSTDIVVVTQYSHGQFKVLEGKKAVITDEKKCILTLNSFEPIAVFSISKSVFDESQTRLDPNYKGETLLPAVITFSSIMLAEGLCCVGLEIFMITKNIIALPGKKKLFSHGLLILGTYINWGTVIILLSETIISVVLGIIIFHEIKAILKWKNKQKSEVASDEKMAD